MRCPNPRAHEVASFSHARSKSDWLATSLFPGDFMKTLLGVAVGTVPLLATGIALAQNGNMMNGSGWGMGWMGGYGGVWGPILLVVVIVAVIALVTQRKGK